MSGTGRPARRGDRPVGESEAPLGVSIEHLTRVTNDQARMLRRRSLRLLGRLLRPHRAWIVGLAVLVVVSQVAAASGPLLLSVAIDSGLPAATRGEWTPLVSVLAVFTVAVVLNALLDNVFTRSSARLSQSVLLQLRTRLFDHTQRLGVDFHQRYTSGRVISRQTNDIESIRALLDAGFGDLVTSVSRILFMGLALLLLDPLSALVGVIVYVPVAMLTRWFQVVSSRLYRESSERSARLIVKFVETVTGIRAVQAFRAEQRNAREYGRLNAEYADASARMIRVFGNFFTGLGLLRGTALAAVVCLNGLRAVDGSVGVGVLVAAALYMVQFFQPMEAVGMFSNTFQSASAALEKISGVLEEEPSVRDPDPVSGPAPVREPAPPRAGGGAEGPVSPAGRPGRVQLRDVTFAYGGGPPVVEHLDLDLAAGTTVALVGRTGAGKSTIASLIARFADPVAGTVLLDGVDLRRIPDAELRRRVVMVTQDAFLFQGTIASNIELGRPGAERSEIEAAVDAIGADFVHRLPDGLDSDISHRGVRLSAGQRQLVSFARVFLADPRVLILDEATSSLDIPSERAVQDALRTLLADRTALVIAHRLSTVQDADRVLVLDAGRVVEDGAPSELIGRGGRFAEMHAAWRASIS